MLGDILTDHRNQLALMRDEKIVGFFNKPHDALLAAHDRFPDGIFSIQEITDEPIWHSYYECPDLSERAQAACEPLPCTS